MLIMVQALPHSRRAVVSLVLVFLPSLHQAIVVQALVHRAAISLGLLQARPAVMGLPRLEVDQAFTLID